MRLRSVLFAPAVRPDLISKLGRPGADGVVIDCEDATPAHLKAEGRDNARTLGGQLAAGGVAVFVRVNGVGTSWFDDDITQAVPAGARGIVVPMVETRTQLGHVAAALERAGRRDLAVIAGLETASGVADARSLLAHPVVTAGYFGAEDFIADMGGVRTRSNNEVLHARSEVALAGRLASVPVLDQVVVEFRDADRFMQEAADARALGYAGKLCIHPAQVALAHEVFTPSGEDVERAQRLLAAYEAAATRGEATLAFEGEMVDEPMARRARAVLDAARET